MKKIIFVVLAIALMIAMLPMSALAAGTTWRVWDTGQLSNALTNAASGDTIFLFSGDYDLGLTTIDKDLTITGDSESGVVIKPTENTGSSDDARGWILVNSGVTLNLSNLTLDGVGFDINQAVRANGTLNAENVTVQNMLYPSYKGHGFALLGSNNSIRNVTMSDIGRVGIGIYGSTTVDNFMYTAKGYGDWLDYGIEVGTRDWMLTTGAPFTVNISNVTITGNLGLVDNAWASSGILVSTYFYADAYVNTNGSGAGINTSLVTVNIQNANISNCSYGVYTGFREAYHECSITTVQNSNFFGNTYDLIFRGKTDAPGSGSLTASGNYYGGSAPISWSSDGLTITGLNDYVLSPVQMSEQTEVTAGIDPSYMIVIPAAVDFGMLMKDSGIQTLSFPVTAYDVIIESGCGIQVAVSSDFNMKDMNGTGTVLLGYDLYNSVPTLMNDGSVFATFSADGTETGSVEVDTSAITAAGSYKGTMDFTISYQ